MVIVVELLEMVVEEGVFGLQILDYLVFCVEFPDTETAIPSPDEIRKSHPARIAKTAITQ